MAIQVLEKPASIARKQKHTAVQAGGNVASTTVQMNVRMQKTLQEQGNAALASIGVNPSEAVRALWAKAAKGGADLKEVRKLLFSASEAQRGCSKLLDGHVIVDDGMAALGISTSAWPKSDFPSYEEIERQARLEKMKQEGMWYE